MENVGLVLEANTLVVKHILKYLRRTGDYMLMYFGEDLTPVGYTDSNFQTC